jgi:hypothetical protein
MLFDHKGVHSLKHEGSLDEAIRAAWATARWSSKVRSRSSKQEQEWGWRPVAERMRLEGRTAVITGAGGGIGADQQSTFIHRFHSAAEPQPNREACESGRKHKAWGVSPRLSAIKELSLRSGRSPVSIKDH